MKTTAEPTKKANKARWTTAGAALSAMVSETLTRYPVFMLTPALSVSTA